jgi:hypothetical protein
VCVGEVQALLNHPVKVWRLESTFFIECRDITIPHIVGKDEYDIRIFVHDVWI